MHLILSEGAIRRGEARSVKPEATESKDLGGGSQRESALAHPDPSMKGDVKSTVSPASVSNGSDIRVPNVENQNGCPGTGQEPVQFHSFLTPFCLLRPNASSSCERWILRLSKPCADHASIWGSRPITISGRARGHSLRPGPWWPRISLILSLDLFLPHCLPHTTWGGSTDRSPG